MVAGGVGGMSFWLVTFPADVIKSRIQVSNLTGSLYTVGLDIFRKEGTQIFIFTLSCYELLVVLIKATHADCVLLFVIFVLCFLLPLLLIISQFCKFAIDRCGCPL